MYSDLFLMKTKWTNKKLIFFVNIRLTKFLFKILASSNILKIEIIPCSTTSNFCVWKWNVGLKSEIHEQVINFQNGIYLRDGGGQ